MQEFTILKRFALFKDEDRDWMEVDVRKGLFNSHSLKPVAFFMSDTGQIKKGTVDKIGAKHNVPGEIVFKAIAYAIATNQKFIDVSRMRGNLDYTIGSVNEDNYTRSDKCALCKHYSGEKVLKNFNDLTEDYIHETEHGRMWKGKNSTRAPPGLRRVRWLSDHDAVPSLSGRRTSIVNGIIYKEYFHARQYMGHPHYHQFPENYFIYIPESEAVLGIHGNVILTFWINLCSLVKMCEVYGDKKRIRCVNGLRTMVLDAPTEMNIPTWEGFGECILPGSDLENKVKTLLKFHLRVILENKVPVESVRLNRATFDFERLEGMVGDMNYTLQELCNYHDYYAIKDLNSTPTLYLESLANMFTVEENEVTIIITNDFHKVMGDKMFTEDTQILVSSYTGFDSLGIPHFLNDVEEARVRLNVPDDITLIDQCIEFVEEKRTYSFNCEKVTKRYVVWFRSDGVWTHEDGEKRYFFGSLSVVRSQLTFEAKKLLSKLTEAYIQTNREKVQSFVFPDSELSEKLLPPEEPVQFRKRPRKQQFVERKQRRARLPRTKKRKWQFEDRKN